MSTEGISGIFKTLKGAPWTVLNFRVLMSDMLLSESCASSRERLIVLVITMSRVMMSVSSIASSLAQPPITSARFSLRASSLAASFVAPPVERM